MDMNMIYRTKNITLNLAWKLIVNSYFILYSAQYILKKIKPVVGSIFYSNNLSYLQFIKDGEIINELFITNNLFTRLTENDKNLKNNFKKLYTNYDFILFKYLHEKNKVYGIRYNNIDELFENNIKFVKSNIEFLTVFLILNGIRYNINLKDKIYYYIVNNYILDFKFIKYYINTYYNFKCDEIDDYDLVILDHKCNTIHLNIKDSIILSEHNYNVIYNNQEINKNISDEELHDNLIDELTNQINDNESKDSSVESKDSDCENLSDIECNNSKINNQKKIATELYNKVYQKTVDLLYWTKYE